MIYLGDTRIGNGNIAKINSVDLTPTNAFAEYDCGSYALKYFDSDYPCFIIYYVKKFVKANGEDYEYHHPFTCDKLIWNGVNVGHVDNGEIFEPQSTNYMMYCFTLENNSQRLKNVWDDTNLGNRGQLTQIYTNGINILGWDKNIGKNSGSNNYYIRDFILSNCPDWNFAYSSSTYGTLGTAPSKCYVSGLKKISGNNSTYLFYSSSHICFPDLEEVNTSYNYAPVFGILAVQSSLDFDKIFPKLKYLRGIPFVSTYYIGFTFYHSTLEYFNLSRFFTATSIASFTKDIYNSNKWLYINCPNVTDFTLTQIANLNSSYYSYFRGIKLGKLTNLTISNTATAIKHAYFFNNIEVGQDTDIDLNLSFFNAGYAIDSIYIDDIETECLYVLNNIRNGLLDKVKDHSTDGETRTITLTNIIITMNNSGFDSVTTELLNIITLFNSKGWTVLSNE